MRDRNEVVLKKIIQYADEISGTIKNLNVNLVEFKRNYIAKNAISMCILQIGELTGTLTDDFKAAHGKVSWRNYTRIRNRAAHAYSSMDMEILWNIATVDIPELKAYCECILAETEK